MNHPKPSLPAHLLVWLAVPLGEWLVGRGVLPAPAPWQWGGEVAAFALLGAAQWRWAAAPEARTLLWPALLVVLTGLAVAGPTEPLSWKLLYLVGLVLGCTTILRGIVARLRMPVPLVLALALAAPVVGRALDLGTLQHRLAAGFGGMRGGEGELEYELRGAPDAWSAQQSDAPTGNRPSIVLVSVDTLRADAAPSMQSWQRLAARGAWWPAVQSTSSWTMPAVASLQTGLPVSAHGADCLANSGCQGIQPGVPTLAEVLAARGYRTAAITANPWITRGTGMARGFHRYVDLAGVPPLRLALAGPPLGLSPQDARVSVDEALHWLASVGNEPFFLWVHLIGPHMPYLHSPDPQLRALTADALRTGGVTDAAFRDAVRKAYEDEVAYTDREVSRLLDALDARGLLDRAVVAMTADHGEELWEHGGVEHGHSHHREVVEVPLVLVAPGIPAGTRAGVASLLDVAPTLAAIAGADASGMAGLDLRSPLPPARVALSWGNLYGGSMRSARDRGARVLGSSRTDADGRSVEHWERYDLAEDPGEQRSTAASVDDRLRQQASALAPPVAGRGAALDRGALKALGYLQ